MPTTSNILGGGVAFNEILRTSNTLDHNGSGSATGAQDGYVEFINTSGSTINIGGWQYWSYMPSVSFNSNALAHTIPNGTMLAPGATYTIVFSPSQGPGAPIGGTVGFATGDVSPSPTNHILTDGAGNFIVLRFNEPNNNADQYYAGDLTAAGLNAGNIVGTIDIVNFADLTFSEAFARFPDGEDSFVSAVATPGTANLCFAPGTMISVPSGSRAVETLKIGDEVLTEDGRAVPVLWVGVQTVPRHRHGAHIQPVRIQSGALGDGLPQGDLTVTADHGMVLDGYVINASALVNRRTIDFVPLAELEDSFTVYHIETEAHDVILANGTPAETFVDAVTRSHFDNHADYLELYGAERLVPEMRRPRITSARLLPTTVRERLVLPPLALTA